MYLLGIDVGSSSVKASLLESDTGLAVASATSPADHELPMHAEKSGWAEQDPESWWAHTLDALSQIKKKQPNSLSKVQAIGITYQMHGLVVVDKNLKPLRQSIIWCDSRAVSIGDEAFSSIGKEKCLASLLNSPGNFTASKLRWVQQNEPELYSQIYKAMLPGDFMNLKLTGEINTTDSALSEGVLWDYQKEQPADLLLSHYNISKDLLPELAPTFGEQGKVSSQWQPKRDCLPERL